MEVDFEFFQAVSISQIKQNKTKNLLHQGRPSSRLLSCLLTQSKTKMEVIKHKVIEIVFNKNKLIKNVCNVCLEAI
jgi:hypothetical protein